MRLYCTLPSKLRSWLVLQAGGQGHADVAVTCLLPLDEGHLKAPAEGLPRAKLITRGGSPFQRGLNSVAASAAEAAKGFFKDVLGRSADSPCHLTMALIPHAGLLAGHRHQAMVML